VKDPWQTGFDPYEVLGVHENSGPQEIKTAFMQAVTKANSQLIRESRSILLDPTAKAIADIVRYRDDYLNNLGVVFAEDDLATLAGRERIIRELTRLEGLNFPDFKASHTLAVVLYWTGIKVLEEDIDRNVTSNPATYARGFLQRAVARFIYLSSNEQFWSQMNPQWQLATDGQEITHRLAERLLSTIEEVTSHSTHDGAKSAYYLCRATVKAELLAISEYKARGDQVLVNGRRQRLDFGPTLALDLEPYIKGVESLVLSGSTVDALLEDQQFDLALEEARTIMQKMPEKARRQANELQNNVLLSKASHLFRNGNLAKAVKLWTGVFAEYKIIPAAVAEQVHRDFQQGLSNYVHADTEPTLQHMAELLKACGPGNVLSNVVAEFIAVKANSDGAALLQRSIEAADSRQARSLIDMVLKYINLARRFASSSETIASLLKEWQDAKKRLEVTLALQLFTNGQKGQAMTRLRSLLAVTSDSKERQEVAEALTYCYLKLYQEALESGQHLRALNLLREGFKLLGTPALREALAAHLNQLGINEHNEALEKIKKRDWTGAAAQLESAKSFLDEAAAVDPENPVIASNQKILNDGISQLRMAMAQSQESGSGLGCLGFVILIIFIILSISSC